jgi:rhodanese-related sulfurtransferase
VGAEISSSTPSVRRQLIDSGEPDLVTVREQDEWTKAHPPGAGTSPAATSSPASSGSAPDPAQRVILYCSAGNRSIFAGQDARRDGPTEVRRVAGRRLHGLEAERLSRRPAVRPRCAASRALQPSPAHPEVGEAGQLKLLDSKVLLIGAGGLGSPRRSTSPRGVGRLGIVDATSSTSRTCSARSSTRPSASASEGRLGEAHDRGAQPRRAGRRVQGAAHVENVERILADGWDVIVDGADNFPTRYLVNDASVWHDIPSCTARSTASRDR